MAFLIDLEQKALQIVWKHKRPQRSKVIMRKKKMGKEESSFLTSAYTTKLLSSKQYGTGTKIEIQIKGTK